MGDAADDFIARRRGMGIVVPQEEEQPAEGYDNWFSGALKSVVSGIPEMFGANPTEAAQEFRGRNPVSGFLTEVLPLLASGVGSELAVTKIPRLARMAEGGVSALGLSAEVAPIRTAAARAFAGQVPLSAAQLGGGALLADEGNYGNVMADVALNQVGAGILGGGFGWLTRSGGDGMIGNAGRYMGKDQMDSPMYHLRAALEDGDSAQFTGQNSLEDNILNLRKEALDERPGTEKFELVGGSKDNNDRLNQIWKINGEPVNGWDIRRLEESAETDLSRLNIGERDGVIKAAGYDDINDIAAGLQHPTVVSIENDLGASKMNKLFAGKGMDNVGDDAWMGLDQYGHAIMVKRVKSGLDNLDPEAAIPKSYGPENIAPGDQFVVGRTDMPGRMAPNSQKMTELNATSWGKVKSAYRDKFGDDMFTARENEMIRSMAPSDLQDVGKLSKRGFVRKRMKEMTDKGLPISQSARDALEKVYDVFAPAVRKELGDPTYGRMMGFLRGRIENGDGFASKAVFGAAKTVGSGFRALGKGLERGEGVFGNRPFASAIESLTQQERNAFEIASNAFVSADDLAKVLPEELITPNLKRAIRETQKLNKDVLDQMVIPGLKQTAARSQLKNMQEHFILPREMQGAWGSVIRDENGVERLYLGGENATVVSSRAKAVIDEAAERGVKFKMDKPQAVVRKGPAAMNDLSEKLSKQLNEAPAEDVLDIVQTAMKKWASLQNPRRAGMKASKKLGAFNKPSERATVRQASDVKAADLIDRAHRHYRDLSRFTGYMGWQKRFQGEIEGIAKVNPKLYDDVIRKGEQYMGIEGKYTKIIDDSLSKVFGSALGGKAGSTIARTTNNMLFLWNQGILNPTASIVNLAGIFQNLLPMIAFLSKATPEAMMKYMQVGPVMNSGKQVVGITGTLEPMRMLKEGWKLLSKPELSADFRKYLNRAVDEGVLANSTDEFVGSKSKNASSLRELYHGHGGGFEGGWEFAKGAMTWMTRKSEELPRLLTFSTMYRMGEDMGLQGENLYRFARNGTRRAMYGYSVVDRSRILTGPLGSMFGLFKNYAFHYMDNMATYSGLAINEGIWSPLLWQVGSTAAVGGLGATPLKILADGMASWSEDSPDSYSWMQKNWKGASDAIYFGLPATLDISLQTSAMMPGTDITQDVGNMFNSVVLDRGLSIAKSVGDAWTYHNATGENPLKNGNIRDELINAFAPRAFNKAASTLGGDHIKSMSTGYPGLAQASEADQVKQFLGFNPITQAGAQVVQKQLWREEERSQAAVASYGMQLAEAQMSGSFERSADVYREATWAGVDTSEISRSAYTRMLREQKGSLSRYGPEALAKYGRDVYGQPLGD